ncbi:hypothetical protein PTSG_00669 [Salpingoeca rosetta]|uniref:Uncharacterized protein n=1 Tax=Salpingoeca rosetta (strain ATCC 50818 / BSB-021) TaxID=946362 RepID=F2TX52_SALR5|nr:uncharacterized protein PTSG_00669 [Salpingoeca rosetta]EGD75961.1 hypothetical protein PTSG_00669 [Salpingoeca rosetta]|eukprot:XP_004998137.1 hypothetical protein PTSG_00669 [Salpingoeca rosetta]
MSERMRKLYTLLETAPKSSNHDTPAKKSERMAACTSLSDAVCSRQNKAGEDFKRLLQLTIEGLLIACADVDSDVRLQADECLNRTIKNLMEAHLPILQVALLKVIKKKEGVAPKSLRTALNKFAELAHLVKPTKREAFVNTFVPNLERILAQDNESVQETAAVCMSKIFEALGLFVQDVDISKLLRALLKNMKSPSPTIRRAASDAAIAICRNSRTPLHHIQQLTNSLFSLFQDDADADDKMKDHATLGKLLAFRKVMITHQQVSKEWGSTEHLLDEPLLERLFELLFSCLDGKNHNVVTSALETLQQLLSVLRRELLSWYRNPERSVPLLQKLSSFLQKGAKHRVSVTALAISCLGQMLTFEPSFFRALVVENAPKPAKKPSASGTSASPSATATTAATGEVGGGDAEEAKVPLAELLVRFQFHDDPLLRGNCYTAISVLLKASLARKHYVFDFVPAPTGESPFPYDECDGHYALSTLCARLVEGLNDPISTVVRSVMLGLRDCVPSMLRSTLGALGVEMLQYMLALRFSSYWLLKVDLADMIGEIDYVLVHYLEQEKRVPRHILDHLPTTTLSFPHRNRPLSSFNSRVQPMAIDTLMQLLGDEDQRVRAKAAHAFVRLTALLFFEEDWPGQDALAAVVERRATYLAGVATSISWFGDGEGNFNRETHLDVPRANLSRIIDMLVQQLRTAQSKFALAGCYHALHTLTSTTELPMEVRYTPASDSPGNPAVYVGDILPLALDHLTLSTVLTDTAMHVDIMALVATIVRRADRSFMEPHFHDLVAHVMRILNICVHVVENRAPNAKDARPERRRTTVSASHGSVVSGSVSSTAATTSPRPRTATEVDISSASFTHRHHAQQESASSPLSMPAPVDDFSGREGRIGAFAHLKHYVELYDLLNATFKASKITLKAEETSKFGDMVRVTLEVLASLVVVEGSAFQQMAQEVIGYLQALMAAEPHNVLVCVHKLIVNLFGSPSSRASARFGRMGGQSSLELQSLDDELDAIADEQFAQQPNTGFFERCIGVTRTHLSDLHLRMSRVSDSSQSKTVDSSMRQRASMSPSRSAGSANRDRMLQFVRQIEPLVLKAMNSYTSTSSIPLQQQIIWLLCRLMTLKVTYTVLDPNQVLVRCLVKQIGLVKSGNVRSAQILLPYVFQFFLLLVNEKGVSLTMEQVVRMASEVIESKHLKPQETLSAFKPFIRYFFVEQAHSYRPSTPAVQEQQQHVVKTLLGRLSDPAVQDQAAILLRAVRHDPDQWKKYSRQFVDSMLPLLSKGKTETRGVRALQTLHRLFESVAPQALRPAKILLRCMFDSILPNIKIPSYITAPDMERERPRSLYAWLPAVLAVMKVLRTTKETELLAGLQSVLLLDTDEERALALVECLFKVIVLVGRHFTHPTTSRSEVLSQQFAQLLQFVYGLVDTCGRQPSSVVFRAAQEAVTRVHETVDGLMDLVIYSNPLIAVYWYQLYGRLHPTRMTRPDEVFGCLRTLETTVPTSVNFGRDIAARGAFLLLCERWALQFAEFSPEDHMSVVALLESNKSSWGQLLLRMSAETPVSQTITHLLCDPYAPHYTAAVEAVSHLWAALHEHSAMTRVQQQMLDQALASRLCKAPASVPLLEMVIQRAIVHNTRAPFVCASADLLIRRRLDDLDLTNRTVAAHLRDIVAPIKSRCPRTYKCLCAALEETSTTMPSPAPEPGAKAQATVEALLGQEPAQSWWDIAFSLVTTTAGRQYPISSIVHLLLSGTPDEFKLLIEHESFDARYLQPLIKGACEGLRSESHLVTCERQWFVRSDNPGATQEASTSSVVKLGQLIVILKRVILARLQRLLQQKKEQQQQQQQQQHEQRQREQGEQQTPASSPSSPSSSSSSSSSSPTPVMLSRVGADVLRAVGALAELHTQASGLRAIWQWKLVRDTTTDEFGDLNDEVRAALDILPEHARALAEAAVCAVEEVNVRLHQHTSMPLPLWPVTVALDTVVLILKHPGVKTHLVREAPDELTPLGIELISSTVDVAYDLFRYTTLSRLPPHPRDPVSRLDLQERLEGDDMYGADADDQEHKKPSEEAAETRVSGLTLLTLHRLGLLTKESTNVLSPRAVGRLLNQYGGRDETLPHFFRLSLNAVVANVAPLVMTSMQQYALCCNPESCKPSSRIVTFLQQLQVSEGVGMRRELLQDDHVAQGLAHRVRIIGFRNTSEEALGLLWTWLRDIVELRDDQLTRESRETTTLLAVRSLTTVLSMIDPEAHTSVFPPYLEVENSLSSYLETVAGLYLHRVHLMQRFDYMATHGTTWRQLGRRMTQISPDDTAKSVSSLRRCVDEHAASGELQCHRFLIYLPQVIEMCLSLVQRDSQAIKILNGACEALHVLLDKVHDAKQLSDIAVVLFDLANSELIADDHIVLRSVIPILCKLQAINHDGDHRRLELISNMLHTALGSQLPSVRMAALTGIKYLAQGHLSLAALPFIDHVRDAVQVLTKHALLEHSQITAATTAWVPRLFWARAFDAAIQVIISFPEEADKANLTYDLTADLSSMCLAPGNLSEASYSRTLSALVRLVLSFVLDSRETDALLTLAGNVNNRSGLFSLLDVSETVCATALLYSKDEYLIHEQLGDASPRAVVERLPLNFGDRITRMVETVVDEPSALVLARSLSFLLTDFWPARQILQMVMAQWTKPQEGPTFMSDVRSRLIAHAHITYHVFARMLSLGFGAAVAEWVCLSLPNVLRGQHWREACICLFSAACGDARQRSLLFLALGSTTTGPSSRVSSMSSSPAPAPVSTQRADGFPVGSGGDRVGEGESGSSSAATAGAATAADMATAKRVDLDRVFLMAGLMFFNSGLLSEEAVHALVNVCSASEQPLCQALVRGCLACTEANS